jgi:selenocysteine-specific elongation factor
VIVGTAGHIDHGKTTLVRALTGMDTDRLPEEKRRGISIELGYAFLDPPGGGERIGFVDVPGHERLVHTMVAGASGIDAALLLVAADDGLMPQTREHLAVLSLLGVGRGVVVVSKIDRVDAARMQAVVAEAAGLTDGTALAGAPVLAVSAHTGEGVEALRAWLARAALEIAPPRADDAAFRLAVDRSFTLDGVGTVVTGTVHAGTVRPGDELVVVPGGLRARVRSVHAQNRAADAAGAGQRCALALAAVPREAVGRGQWLVAPQAALDTDRIDARLTLWAGEAKALRSGTPVHLHVGAAVTQASVAVLDGESIAPGAQARVQLVLRERVGAWHGDRVVLRDASASRTIAGGRVLDPHAPVRYRRTPQRLAQLAALEHDAVAARLAALLEASAAGVDLQRFAAAQGRTVAAPADALQAGSVALAAAHAHDARGALLAALGEFHRRAPDDGGPDPARLRRLALPRLPDPAFRAVLAALQAEGAVTVRGATVQLPEHAVRLSATEQRIAESVAPKLAEAGFEGAWVRDLARAGGGPEPMLRTTLSRLARRGELHQVVKDLFYPPPTMARLAAIARGVADSHAGEVTAAAFRDATGLGRKRAIQILEYFDRIGYLRRVRDTHRLRPDCALFEAQPGEALR